MAKLISSVVVISVLFAIIAYASAYRTTITTVEIDEPNRSRGQSCRSEVETKDLSSCEQYIRQSRRRVDEVLALRGEENQQELQLRQCCNQLRQVRDECQCEAINSVVEDQIQGEREEYQRVMQRASNIPSACNLRQRCDFRRIMF